MNPWWRRAVGTHFRVLVVLDETEIAESTRQLTEWLTPALAPFDEELEVEPLEVTCDCLTMDSYWDIDPATQRFVKTGPKEVGKADPTCSECKGTGKYMTTRNPRGLWDYWTAYEDYVYDKGMGSVDVSRGIKVKDLPENTSCAFALLPGGVQVGDKYGNRGVTLDGPLAMLLLPYGENVAAFVDMHS